MMFIFFHCSKYADEEMLMVFLKSLTPESDVSRTIHPPETKKKKNATDQSHRPKDHPGQWFPQVESLGHLQHVPGYQMSLKP